MSAKPNGPLVETYLFFDGRCEEAIEFYRRALGAEVLMMMRYKENPEPHTHGVVPAGSEDKIMHASIRIGRSRMMASDGHCAGTPTFHGFTLSLTTRDEEEGRRWFAALADGGRAQMPLGRTFFSPCFGMVVDRFGVSWMIHVEPSE